MLQGVAGVGIVGEDVETHLLKDLPVLDVLCLRLVVLLSVVTDFLPDPGPEFPPLRPSILDARVISEKARPFPERLRV